jgi:hypothetical protein
MLLDRGRRHFPEELLDIGGHMHRLDQAERANPLPFALAQEIRSRPSVCCSRVLVADIDGEEFEEAPRGRSFLRLSGRP